MEGDMAASENVGDGGQQSASPPERSMRSSNYRRSSFYLEALKASQNYQENFPYLPEDVTPGAAADSNSSIYPSTVPQRSPSITPPVTPSISSTFCDNGMESTGISAAAAAASGAAGFGEQLSDHLPEYGASRTSLTSAAGAHFDASASESSLLSNFYASGSLTPQRRASDDVGVGDPVDLTTLGEAGVDIRNSVTSHVSTDCRRSSEEEPSNRNNVTPYGEAGLPPLDENLLMQFKIEAQIKAAKMCKDNTGYDPLTVEDDEGDSESGAASEDVRPIIPPPKVKQPKVDGLTPALPPLEPPPGIQRRMRNIPAPKMPRCSEMVMGCLVMSSEEERSANPDGLKSDNGKGERTARCLGCGGILCVPDTATLMSCPKCGTVSPTQFIESA